MTEVRRVGLDDFDAIHRRLLSGLNPDLGVDDWKRLFTYRWAGAQDYAGYGLFQQQNPVGFVGLVFSERPIKGRIERFCNVTTWVVEPEHRNQGISLLAPIVGLRDCTITNLTATPAVQTIFSALGFRVLDGHVRVVWPMLRSTARDVVVENRIEAIIETVAPSVATIVKDHQPYVHQILLRSGDRQCLVVYRLGRRRRLRVARIHHVEGTDFFPVAIGSLRRELLWRHGALLLEMDERLCPAGTAWTTRVQLPVPRLYRSATVAPADISNLYSEFILLPL